MREIKFKIFDQKTNEMYYLLKDRFSFGPFEGCRAVSWEDVFAEQHEELIPLQYTGLKGKNGREIWEGDIRKDDWGRKFKVVYDNDLAAFYGEYINGPSESLADCGPDSEYLGTVYENPDLLLEATK
ncbi:YopX family protein [Bacillus swezeyi]|uniref:YopX family protein n=1 Tax=Bacillus swezeyi TaxID=1925020 RepID=UPI002E215BA0|nr:YopX family protein [Bacillus swezeyi]